LKPPPAAIHLTVAAAVFLLWLAGCGGPPPTGSIAGSPTASSSPGIGAGDRVAGWASDLDLLLPGIEMIHPDPYHSTPKPQLVAAIAALKESVAQATDDELMIGLLRIVAQLSASGRDGHTGAFIWGTDSAYPVHSLPLRLWFFADGLYVVDALPPYENLIGSRVDGIAGRPVEEVQAAIEPLVPRDNDETVVLLTPRFLLIPEVLHGLGIIGQVGPVELTLADQDAAVAVEPIAMVDYNAWAGPYGLHLPDDPDVLYLSRTDDVLWWTMLEESHDLYVQYNRVEDLDTDLLGELRDAAARDGVDRVIVDIRHNFGGQTFAYPPLLEVLKDERIGSKPLFVITGRNTFSAASLFAAEIDRETDATFVGEPMGGSPNLFGNPGSVALPFSGLTVTVAGEYFVRSTPDDRRLTIKPDIPVALRAQDYFAHRDPSLEAIQAAGS
jgi:hypothetical protein